MAANQNQITLQNSRIGFLNFSGAEGKFNRAGDRNFCVFLEPEVADQMMKDGWNVKYLKPRDEQEDRQAYLQVAVKFENRPPKIFLVTSRNKTKLDEDMVSMVDFVEIDYADLILTAYHWNVNGNTGVKAYLNTAYIVIVENALDQKYIDVPDSGMSALTAKGETLELEGEILEDLGEMDGSLELER